MRNVLPFLESHGPILLHTLPCIKRFYRFGAPTFRGEQARHRLQSPSMAEYAQAVVTFVDILGFSDLIQDSRGETNKNPERVDKILRVLKELKRASNLTSRITFDDEGNESSLLFADNFSDCLVRSTPIDYPADAIEAMEAEVLLLASIQAAVTTKEDILIRGGMSMGELYRDKKGEFLFGPAFVDAYKLEKTAVVPRIVIDQEIVNSMTQYESDLLNNYVKQDSDGVAFVDYLHGAYSDFGRWPITGVDDRNEMISDHKASVERKSIELQSKSIDVRLKAHWMALYHNQVIERLITDTPSLRAHIDQFRVNTTNLR